MSLTQWHKLILSNIITWFSTADEWGSDATDPALFRFHAEEMRRIGNLLLRSDLCDHEADKASLESTVKWLEEQGDMLAAVDDDKMEACGHGGGYAKRYKLPFLIRCFMMTLDLIVLTLMNLSQQTQLSCVKYDRDDMRERRVRDGHEGGVNQVIHFKVWGLGARGGS